MTERLSTYQAAEIAGVSDKTIRDWIKAGRLPAERVGKRVYISRADIEPLIQLRSSGAEVRVERVDVAEHLRATRIQRVDESGMLAELIRELQRENADAHAWAGYWRARAEAAEARIPRAELPAPVSGWRRLLRRLGFVVF